MVLAKKRNHRLIDFLLSNYFLLSNPLLQRILGAPRVFVCLLFYPDSLSKGKEFYFYASDLLDGSESALPTSLLALRWMLNTYLQH